MFKNCLFFMLLIAYFKAQAVMLGVTVLQNPQNGNTVYLYSDVHFPVSNSIVVAQTKAVDHFINQSPEATIYLDSYVKKMPCPSSELYFNVGYFIETRFESINKLQASLLAFIEGIGGGNAENQTLLACADKARVNDTNSIQEDPRIAIFVSDQQYRLSALKKLKLSISNLKKHNIHSPLEQCVELSQAAASAKNFSKIASDISWWAPGKGDTEDFWELDTFDLQILEGILSNNSKKAIVLCGVAHTFKIREVLTKIFNFSIVCETNKELASLTSLEQIDEIHKNLYRRIDEKLTIQNFSTNSWITKAKLIATNYLYPGIKNIITGNWKACLYKICEQSVSETFGIATFDDLMVPVMLDVRKLQLLNSDGSGMASHSNTAYNGDDELSYEKLLLDPTFDKLNPDLFFHLQKGTLKKKKAWDKEIEYRNNPSNYVQLKNGNSMLKKHLTGEEELLVLEGNL